MIQVARKADWLRSEPGAIELCSFNDLFPFEMMLDCSYLKSEEFRTSGRKDTCVCSLSSKGSTRTFSIEGYYYNRWGYCWVTRVFQDNIKVNINQLPQDGLIKGRIEDTNIIIEEYSTEYTVAKTITSNPTIVLGGVASNIDGYRIKYKYFKNDKLDLIPCVLTQTIGSSLSSDGKVHQVGECGMWDLNSDKFFGNSGTTGSFTVYYDDPEAEPEYIELSENGVYSIHNGVVKKMTDCVSVKDGIKRQVIEIWKVINGIRKLVWHLEKYLPNITKFSLFVNKSLLGDISTYTLTAHASSSLGSFSIGTYNSTSWHDGRNIIAVQKISGYNPMYAYDNNSQIKNITLVDDYTIGRNSDGNWFVNEEVIETTAEECTYLSITVNGEWTVSEAQVGDFTFKPFKYGSKKGMIDNLGHFYLDNVLYDEFPEIL